MDDQVAPVLHILAAPDQLRVQVAVAALVGHTQRLLLLLVEHRLVFGGRRCAPRGVDVGEGCYRFAGGVWAIV